MTTDLKRLFRYQELIFALSERESSSPRSSTDKLETSIKRAEARLPKALRPRLVTLRTKSPVVIAPVENGGCGVCRNTLPTAVEQAVKANAAYECCPACGRILYLPDGTPRQTGKRTSNPFRGNVSGIAQYTSEALIIPKLAAKTPEGAIRELAELLEEQGFIEDAGEIAALALEREKIAPTAVERALAFPHVRGVEGGGLVMAIGMRRQGYDFGSPDGKKTKILFFSVIPSAAGSFYLKMLAELMCSFHDAQARHALLAAPDSAEAWKTLCDLTAQTVP